MFIPEVLNVTFPKEFIDILKKRKNINGISIIC